MLIPVSENVMFKSLCIISCITSGSKGHFQLLLLQILKSQKKGRVYLEEEEIFKQSGNSKDIYLGDIFSKIYINLI